MLVTGILIGLAVGILLTVSVGWLAQRRHLRRVRVAERRARNAERMAEIGGMTGGLAHEIKNPLSTIGLNAQLLLEAVEELPIDESDRAPLINRTKSLRRETDRLGGILADFLQYAGQVVLDLREADLNVVVSELVDFFLPEAERHGVRLRADAAPEPLIARVDPKLVKQALLNLMLNAVQAMGAPVRPAAESGAAVSAPSAGAPPAKELLLRVRRATDPDGTSLARIDVIDTGPGIARENLDRIFTPYFTTRSGGSGLGLPTSRRLIAEHGGRIDVHSEPGRGSDFAVILPIGGPIAE